MMKKTVKNFLNKHQKLRFFIKNTLGKGCIYNYFDTQYEKNCLLMYVTLPFISDNNDSFHQAYWQQRKLAKAISIRGYNVDVIDYNNSSIKLRNNYDLVIDLIPGVNPVFRKNMNPGCKTIAYLTGSNATFQNAAEKRRIEDLYRRRGVRVKPRRQSPYLTKAIENYSACFMIGNEYNWRTYDEFNLGEPYFIKNTGFDTPYRFNEDKKDKKSFLYFGSSGQVHKGLDLLLEIFSEKDFPCELYVCGAFKDEQDFEEVYRRELYECKNIHAVGFVDINSKLFEETVARCVFSILPSCSEANAGAILTTMSAGLISICSFESGFEDDEVIHLDNCRVETIRKTVLEYSSKDIEWIKKESKRQYDIIQERYSKECFLKSVNEALDAVL